MDLICHKRWIVRQRWMPDVSLTVGFVRHLVKLGLLSQLTAIPGPLIDVASYSAGGFCVASVTFMV